MPHINLDKRPVSVKASAKGHIDGFCNLLSSIDPCKITKAEVPLKYLQYLLINKKYFVNIYASVLDALLACSAKNLSDISIIDCGAGNGLLGIFAKYCGCKRVYINDVDPTFIASAKRISAELVIVIDDFISGDILNSKERLASIQADAVIGTDVIEHIYSIDNLFSLFKEVNPNIISVFTTAANPYNYAKVKEITRIQLKDELEELGDNFFSGPHIIPPYLKIREDIIREKYSFLPEEKVKTLASLTRGMTKEHILIAIENYYSKNVFPQPPYHLTNTCNPLDGNWTERLLSLKEYHTIYRDHGFLLSMKNGFYNEHQKGIKGKLIYILNRIIVYLPYFGKYFAPFICLIGTSVNNRKNKKLEIQ